MTFCGETELAVVQCFKIIAQNPKLRLSLMRPLKQR